MKQLVQQLCAQLKKGEDVVLVTICNQSGSTPRVAGAKMMVCKDGSIAGTIGGGMVEALAMKHAGHCFEQGCSMQKSFDLTNSEAANTDMICGGKLDIYLDYIKAGESNLEVFNSLLTAVAGGRRVTLVCPVGTADRENRFVIDSNGLTTREDIAPDLLTEIKRVRTSTSSATMIEHDGNQYLLSYFTVGGHLFLLGAGHVSACTAEVAARVGFRITVMDDRAEFANEARFPMAENIVVLSNFDDCFADQEINEDSYLVIVTRGHMHDLEVLEQALQTNAGYIGMIGSRKKRDALYKRLLEKGISHEQLEQVHSPIGLSIEADTPEEIAISIMGELIYKRATGHKTWQTA
ncbi:XdhC family aldehyde oxidoreductase maturation factor [Desulfogranum japonicum]|uniref:XdhC family aldehyde oxidoreductase maturation factor n=1 Tax=Desulfogranum japonicum TaxID=231447 RepID=UPI00040519DF|nr:XdhC/CoxI family protein [Desulfogranum japonicum]